MEERVLFVDDERTVRTAYKRMLECEGYDVLLARNGREAVELFLSDRPSLVLLDVDMPGMNGFVTCRKLREIDRFTPIVFLTAMETDADQLRGLGLGADDYVYKSASTHVLLARVANALARSKARDDSCSVRHTVTLGRISVDLETFSVEKDGCQISRLTRTEAAILRTLNRKRGEICPFEHVVESAWGEGHVIDISTMRSFLLTLRRKLDIAGGMIITEREIGYRLLK